MKAKEFLLNIKRLDDKINDKLDRVYKLKECITNTSPVQSDGSAHGNCNADKTGQAISEIIEIEKEVNMLTDCLTDLKQQAIAIILKMPSKTYRSVLYFRYIKFKTWREIATGISTENNTYTSDNVRTNLHRYALKQFEKYM